MLYRRAKGAAIGDQHPARQAFHDVTDEVLYTGQVTVSHGHALSRAVARAGGMPGRSGTMPFQFRATRDGDHEIWERSFDGHITRSLQWLHAPGIVAERVGTSEFLMHPMAQGAQLHIPITRIRGFGLPVPQAMVVQCDGVEGVADDGAITFDVQAKMRGIGLIIRYQGKMARA